MVVFGRRPIHNVGVPIWSSLNIRMHQIPWEQSLKLQPPYSSSSTFLYSAAKHSGFFSTSCLSGAIHTTLSSTCRQTPWSQSVCWFGFLFTRLQIRSPNLPSASQAMARNQYWNTSYYYFEVISMHSLACVRTSSDAFIHSSITWDKVP